MNWLDVQHVVDRLIIFVPVLLSLLRGMLVTFRILSIFSNSAIAHAATSFENHWELQGIYNANRNKIDNRLAISMMIPGINFKRIIQSEITVKVLSRGREKESESSAADELNLLVVLLYSWRELKEQTRTAEQTMKPGIFKIWKCPVLTYITPQYLRFEDNSKVILRE